MEARSVSHLTQQGGQQAVGKMNNSQKVFISSELFVQYPVAEHNKRMIEAVNTELTVVGL